MSEPERRIWDQLAEGDRAVEDLRAMLRAAEDAGDAAEVERLAELVRDAASEMRLARWHAAQEAKLRERMLEGEA